MATNPMHSMNSLIRRLEAATSRLEYIASSTESLPGAPTHDGVVGRESLKSSSLSPDAAALQATDSLPVFLQSFDTFLSTSVDEYVQASRAIDPLLADQALIAQRGFVVQRQYLVIASQAKKPDDSTSGLRVLQALLKPTNDAILEAIQVKDSNRSSPFYNNLSTVAEGIMVLAWVTIDTQPYKHAEACSESAQFWGDRVLKELSEKDPRHTAWIQSFYRVIRDLRDYIEGYFPQGLLWDPHGRPAQEVADSLGASAAHASSAGAPPPPPPPLPPPAPALPTIDSKAPASSTTPSGRTGLSGVFSEINKGEGITKSLRKVEKSQMTHKNPSLAFRGTVPGTASSGATATSAPGRKANVAKKPATKELNGKKWIIENFENESQPIEIKAELSHNILISNCSNTTIIIKGKANAVTVENTTRVSLILDSLVSAVDVIRSQNFALQVVGIIPSVLMDETDGAQIYLSGDGAATRLFCSKSAGINLNVRSGKDDYKEIPLPTQICSFYNEAKGVLESEIVAYAG